MHPTRTVQRNRRVPQSFLNLMFGERGHQPLKGAEDAKRIQAEYCSYAPRLHFGRGCFTLLKRKYVVLRGLGTGKTRMALELLKDEYEDNGMTIQFH